MNVEAFHARLQELYLPPAKQFTIVDVAEIRFAVIEGKGNPAKRKLVIRQPVISSATEIARGV